MPSILHPMTCGFAKVRCYNIFICKSWKGADGDLLSLRKSEFSMSFGNNESFELDTRTSRNCNIIVKNIQALGKTNPTGKANLMHFFSSKSWNSLSHEEKTKHSVFNCLGCTGNLLYKSKLAIFKNSANPFKRNALENLFPEAVDAVATYHEVREVLDKTFESRYKETFTNIHEAVTSGPQMPKSPPALTQKQRNLVGKEFKDELEKVLAANSVERYKFLLIHFQCSGQNTKYGITLFNIC